MISLVPFRDDMPAPYMAAVLAAMCGSAALRPSKEIELLKQTMALCEAALNIPLSYPLPPEDSLLGARVAWAAKQMQVDWYLFDQDGTIDEVCHVNNMRDELRRYARRRIAALEKRIASRRRTARKSPRGGGD